MKVTSPSVSAASVAVRGVVQGVGFRPFVYQLARTRKLRGWVSNGNDGVQLHVEGDTEQITFFIEDLRRQAPPASNIVDVRVVTTSVTGVSDFTIRPSETRRHPTVCISPDLSVCGACLTEMRDANDRRFNYPYINCTNCGPRYSIIRALPYDRVNTTMAPWQLDAVCASQYADPDDRRFHAQPVACPACGPHYYLLNAEGGRSMGVEAIRNAVQLLRDGRIVAIKGVGGYHLACDANNTLAVNALRHRKYRKEKPFAVMVRDLAVARRLVALSEPGVALLTGPERPIVLACAVAQLPGIAPNTTELGVMLPYAPLHHLLFDSGAPDVLVMTSANRSNEPIAYKDDDAFERLGGISDAFLVGERAIARRVDDSVVRLTGLGPTIIRRSRGYAPASVASLPAQRPILALGADLKNTVTLVVRGEAFMSQHIGDLDQYDSHAAFLETVEDLLDMYNVDRDELVVVRDLHPQFRSTQFAAHVRPADVISVQHHRAHIASVLAERGVFDKRVVGVSFDGTGYGDDGSIWGGEFFVGSVRHGFVRTAHMRSAALVGGDAAARYPVQAAVGFLDQLVTLPDLAERPFCFDRRLNQARAALKANVRVFQTTSVGRLFDAAAALAGFTGQVTYEGQAACWLEYKARRASTARSYELVYENGELDFRALLTAMIDDRVAGCDIGAIARGFHNAVAQGVHVAAMEACRVHETDTVVLSGGVFQNAFLLEEVTRLLMASHKQVWVNHTVPPNDGGVSLGQAALAAFSDSIGTSTHA